MSATSLTEGTLFAGRYRIVRCIAAGGMGAVYEVVHVETDRRRALKVMHAQFLQSQELRDRFRQEARVAAQIESEFIVDVFDAGIDDATQMPFLVMELLKGEELGKLLHRRGRLSPSEVVTYLHQAALALDKTHRAQIVHRDLKPENLFVTEREDGAPRIKILDFGIAKVVADSGTNVNATRSIGTPLYMAPEQFKPGHRVSPAADLYALSMMAYTLLVGKTYWAEEAEGGNVFAFAGVAMMGTRDPATVRARRSGAVLRPAFDAWFARATTFQPEARYPSATATVAALAEALGVPLPGISASGPQGVAADQTQLLGSPDCPSSPGLPFSGSQAGLGEPHAQSSPALHASGRVSGFHASGHHAVAGHHGSEGAAGLHGSGGHGGALHGSGPIPVMPGGGGTGVYPGGHPALHTSVSGALGGTLAAPAARPKSAVLTGVLAGLLVCVCGVGAAVFVMGRGGAAGEGPVEVPLPHAAASEGAGSPAGLLTGAAGSGAPSTGAPEDAAKAGQAQGPAGQAAMPDTSASGAAAPGGVNAAGSTGVTQPAAQETSIKSPGGTKPTGATGTAPPRSTGGLTPRPSGAKPTSSSPRTPVFERDP